MHFVFLVGDFFGSPLDGLVGAGDWRLAGLGAVFVALSIVVSASFVLARGRDFEWSSLEQVRQERHQHIAWPHTRIEI